MVLARILPVLACLVATLPRLVMAQYGVPDYALFDLGVLEPDHPRPRSWGYALDNFGSVVGSSYYSKDNNASEAFIWNATDGMRTLGFYNSISSIATAINDGSVIAGDSGGCVMWLPSGDIVPIGDLGGGFCVSSEINNTNHVVGESTNGDSELLAFFWDGSTILNLGTLGGLVSSAQGINDFDQVVGWAGTADIRAHAFYWDASSGMIDLGLLAGDQSGAYAIDNNGLIVGYGELDTQEDHAVIWDQQRMIQDIHPDAIGTESRAYKINELGQVLLKVVRHSGEGATVVWQDGQWSDLEQRLPPLRKRILNFPTDLNDHGQICGYYTSETFQARALLATPVNPTLELTPLVRGKSGAMNAVRVTGLNPGQRVYLMWGVVGGGTVIPGCDILDNVSQIEHAKFAVQGLADADGVATLTGFMPSQASERTILIQAIAPDTCSISNLVQQTIE